MIEPRRILLYGVSPGDPARRLAPIGHIDVHLEHDAIIVVVVFSSGSEGPLSHAVATRMRAAKHELRDPDLIPSSSQREAGNGNGVLA